MILKNLFALLACVSLTTACMSYEREKQIVSGSLTNEALLSQVIPGDTTANWLVAQIGEPDVVTPTGNGSEQWSYSAVTHSKTNIRALPLIAVKLRNEKRVVHYFEIRDEVVERMWQERLQ